jgi:hypothetical protein
MQAFPSYPSARRLGACRRMNNLENYYIQFFQHKKTIVNEQAKIKKFHFLR